MAHGFPDWGIAAPKKTVYALQDMAEAVARLGSIVTFDRRGDVIRLDDFESGLVKCELSIGAGGSIVACADTVRSGVLSAKLVTGAVSGRMCTITHHLPQPVLSRMGYEVSFAQLPSPGYIQWTLHLTIYSDIWYGLLRYVPIDRELLLYGSDGAWKTIDADLWLRSSKYLFHTVKIVMDFDTKYWVRAILNHKEYDLSAYELRHEFITLTEPWIYGGVQISTGDDAAKTVYVDDVIITQNEP